MKIIKVEFNNKTSKAIYCDVTYKNIFGKVKTREAYLRYYYVKNEEISYNLFPRWSDNGKYCGFLGDIEALELEIIRQYEITLNNKS